MTGYSTESQKNHAEKDRKQENKKKVEMVTFSKTSYKLLSIFLEKKKIKNYAADPKILSCMG